MATINLQEIHKTNCFNEQSIGFARAKYQREMTRVEGSWMTR